MPKPLSPRWLLLLGPSALLALSSVASCSWVDAVAVETCPADLPPPDLEVAPAVSARLVGKGMAASVADSLSSWFEGHGTRRLYLQLDRPLYRPGETVWFASWDLRTADLEGEGASRGVRFALLDPRGAEVATADTEQEGGRTHLDLAIPADAAGGLWTLRATTMDGEQLDRIFVVDRYEAPRIRKELDFAREAYGAGDTVRAAVELEGSTSGPLADTPVQALVQVDGELVAQLDLKTDAAGELMVEFALPATLSRGDGLLTVLVDASGVTESISRTIPITASDLNLSFYPEGGDLVEGLPGRVYLEATDVHGRPADARGRVEDENGEVVARFDTVHDGLGAFPFLPEIGHRYQAVVEAPAGIARRYPLPGALGDGCVLHAYDDVQGVREELQVGVRCSTPREVTVVGSLREALLDSATVLAGPDEPAVIELLAGDEAVGRRQGVARITVLSESLEPLAERVVYRNPGRDLQIAIQADRASYSPRDEVVLTVRTTDASGAPVPAEVALSVADDTTLRFADDERGHILSRLYLESEIPTEIDDPGWYFDQEEENARRGLDLLMGTKGWRRFAWSQVLVPGDGGVALAETNNPDALAPLYEELRQQRTARVWEPKTRTGWFQDGREVSQQVGLLGMLGHAGGFNEDLFGDIGGMIGANGVQIGAGGLGARGAGLGGGGMAEGLGGLGTKGRGAGAAAEPKAAGNLDLVRKRSIAKRDEGKLAREERKDVKPREREARHAPPMKAPASLMAEADEARDNRAPASEAQWAQPAVVADLEMMREVALDPAPMARPIPQGGAARGDANQDRAFGYAGPARPAGTVDIGAVEIGGADPGPAAEIRLGIKRYQSQARYCIQREQVRDPSIEGRVDLSLTIRDGRVVAADSKQNSTGSDAIAQCLASRSRAWRFGEGVGEGAPVEVSVPFVISAPPPAPAPVVPRQVEVWTKARTFPKPHATPGPVAVRTDFRDTVLWEPVVQTDETGTAELRFSLSDAITTFRATAEGVAGGLAGRGEATFASVLPFHLEARLPDALSYGDRLLMPVTVDSTLDELRAVHLAATVGSGLTLEGAAAQELRLAPGEKRTIFLPVLAEDHSGTATISLRGEAGGLHDGLERSLEISPRGFPRSWSVAGDLESGQQRFTVELGEILEGTLVADLDLHPGPISTLLDGLEGMLRTPGGCFEQTSSSNYPNVLVLDYLRTMRQEPRLQVDREQILSSGYTRLSGYQVGAGGFETWGTGPGKEALSAFGLRQFTAMKRVYEGVTDTLLSRDRDYLLGQRDGKGGYRISGESAHGYGAAPKDTLDAYITWALVSTGTPGMAREIAHARELAKSTQDPYVLALSTATLATADPQAARMAAGRLVEKQAADGSFPGAASSIMRSGGSNLEVETTALATMALLQIGGSEGAVRKAVGWLHAARDGGGAWGATQSTVAALEALTMVARSTTRTRSSGEVKVQIDGHAAGSLSWKAGQSKRLRVEGLEAALGSGAHTIVVNYESPQEIPFDLDLRWRARTPASDAQAAVALHTELAAHDLSLGQAVRLTASLENKSGAVVPSPIARIGLPAGLEAQTRQLEELKKKGQIAFFETGPREVVLYWDGLGAEETHTVGLDLVATVPGSFAGPASSAWPYYDDTFKSWASELEVVIRPE